jgi:hypothetical protein
MSHRAMLAQAGWGLRYKARCACGHKIKRWDADAAEEAIRVHVLAANKEAD